MPGTTNGKNYMFMINIGEPRFPDRMTGAEEDLSSSQDNPPTAG